jgi:peptide-methionine (S)-S-oxide reductase
MYNPLNSKNCLAYIKKNPKSLNTLAKYLSKKTLYTLINKNPSYKEVCAGITGHAEVCQLVYDTTKVSFDVLLQVFWKTHDPTTMNRQGNDIGTQYRSAIYYHNEDQRIKAESYKKQLNEVGAYPNPIITEIKPFTVFYAAEDYHQNYYNQNSDQGYCQYVIQPKIEKLEKVFKDKLKK